MRVGIAGGGLGGLAAALFLLRAGVEDVRVFEQQSALQEIGAGIQIAPNAVRLLQRLGLSDALLAVAVPFEVPWEFRRWEDGRVLFSQARYEARRASARRTSPSTARPAAGARRRAAGGRGLARPARQRRRRRRVRLRGRLRRAAFDAVIGADGIHSVVRAAIVGDESPEFTGLAAYRALVPAERGAGVRAPAGLLDLARAAQALRALPGLGRRAGQPRHREPGGRLARGVVDGAGEVADFLAEYEGWDERVVSLIAAARETKRYAFYAREPVTRWVAGRVALLGDAAHPMLPFFAQGAGQAIEDGAVLAGCLARALGCPGGAAALRVAARRARDARAADERRAPRAPPHARRPGAARARRGARRRRTRSATTSGSTGSTSRPSCARRPSRMRRPPAFNYSQERRWS